MRIVNRFSLFTSHKVTALRIEGDSRRGGWLPASKDTEMFIRARGLEVLTDYHTAPANHPDYPAHLTLEQVDYYHAQDYADYERNDPDAIS